MFERSLAVVTGFCALALLPTPASGQVRASERATVSQTVDGTVISLEYSRPQVKDRAPLFGGLVRWDSPWTGANEATVLEVNRDVTIQGRHVPAGRWSVWLVPREDGPWEFFLDPRPGLWHTSRPEPTEEQIRVPVTAAEGEHVEALTWTFPRVAPDGATMELAWGTARVPVEIEVEPFYPTTVPEEQGRLYTGSWTWRFGTDTRPGEPASFDVTYTADGELRVRTLYPIPDVGMADSELILLPKAEGIFVPLILRDGRIYDTAAYLYFEFEFEEDGVPTRFVVRWASNDAVMGRGNRSDSADETL